MSFETGSPLCEQIVYAVKKAVIAGKMRPGDPFLSVRALSKALGINANTAHKVVTRLTAFGKHERDLPGAPRTGNDLKMTSITIHRIADGRLAEKWAGKDVVGFLQQIGVMRAPEPPKS